MAPKERMLKTSEAAIELRSTDPHVRRLIAVGKLRAFNVSASPGRPTYRIPESSVRALIAAETTVPQSPSVRRRRRTSDVEQII